MSLPLVIRWWRDGVMAWWAWLAAAAWVKIHQDAWWEIWGRQPHEIGNGDFLTGFYEEKLGEKPEIQWMPMGLQPHPMKLSINLLVRFT